MGPIISIHEYDLKSGIDLQQFEQGKHRLKLHEGFKRSYEAACENLPRLFSR